MSNLVELKIESPDNAPLLAAESAFAAAEARTITTAADATAVAQDLKEIKHKAREIEAMRKSLVAPIDEARARIQAFFKPPLDFLQKAESALKGKLLAYQDAERRIAQEAARKEAERLRKLAEAKAKRAEKRGDVEAAEELREQPIIVPTAAPTALEGTSVRVLWRAELVDIRELCRAIADGKAPADLVRFEQAAGNRLATALKDAADVPGVRFTREESMAVRS